MDPDSKINSGCISYTFVRVKEEIKNILDEKLKENYKILLKHGKDIIHICKGTDAPEYCQNIEIESCEDCKDYRSYT
ncbi:hypothetical protein HYZ41_04330 [archaeon]|nr:hypothetical protein [archaeon]